ncbi:MAG: type II CAAX prenyl endopeptidase Rce1 family protein [Polyangiales bacterium]
MLPSRSGRLDLPNVAAAALTVQPFVLYQLAVCLLLPPTEAQWRHADPILRILPHAVTLGVVPVLGVALGFASCRVAGLDRRSLRAAMGQAALGIVAAAVVAVSLRMITGPTLPAFIPPEESARPGPTLNLAAGLLEELLFRLIVLPWTFAFAARKTSADRAAALAIAATGLAFALLHQAGPGQTSALWFATRLIFPGCAMSLVAWRVGPSFLVAAHCTAHVLIPWMFA